MNILHQVPCGDYLEVCVGSNFLSNTYKTISFSLFLFFFPFLYMVDLNVAKTKLYSERGVYLFDVDANRTIGFIATKQDKNRVNGSKIFSNFPSQKENKSRKNKKHKSPSPV